MGAIVGIDLGTTNTVVAAVREGVPIAIQDETGSSLIPSIVSFLPSGAVLVGDAAKERRTDDAKNTVFSVKRLIGRPWDSPEVTRAREQFPFELKEGPGRATFVVARNETFTLPEISAYVLRKAKSIAELELGESVDRAIITVPANFNDLQRAATKVAGRVAGLDVLRIINEPTAAALAYGYNQNQSAKIAVFDFGGGTFDITLLSLTDTVFEVLATAGDTFLGGDDLDWAIVERMFPSASAALGHDVRQDPVALEHLRAAAETIKIRLTTATKTELPVELGAQGTSASPQFRFSFTRAELDQLAQPILDKAFDVCREALKVARLGTADLDHVIAVGGCTRIPFVRQRAHDFFGKPLEVDVDPHEVVAIGAALQGHALTSPVALPRLEVPRAPEPTALTFEQGQAEPLRRKTNPFGKMGTTNVGLGQAPGEKFEAIQVPGPNGVPSRPMPNTQNLVSRGRLDTAIGVGPDIAVDSLDWDPPDSTPVAQAGDTHDDLDPESLLPVVIAPGARKHSQAHFRPPEFSNEAAGLQEPDDDEATMVRGPSTWISQEDVPLPEIAFDRAADSERAWPSANTQTTEQIPVRATEDPLLPTPSHSRQTATRTAPIAVHKDLPATANASITESASKKATPTAQDSDTGHLSKPPTTDELRQRYGDLPLIIGGKRLSSIPSGRPSLSPDLPLVRPTLDTIQDLTPLPEYAPEKPAPKPRTLAATATIPDTELPLVGVQSRATTEASPKIPAQRKPAPPRAAPNRPQLARNSPRAEDTPLPLNDSDVLEETQGQPPSAGRISIRPNMRMEPGEEASLPLPNLPNRELSATPPSTRGASLGIVGSDLNASDAGKLGSANQPAKSPTAGNAFQAARALQPQAGAPPRTVEAKSATLAGVGGSLPGGAALSGAATASNREARPAVTGTQSSPLVPASAPAAKALRDGALPSAPVSHYGITVPLLIDVTPLSLSVETVGLYCDVLIDRNTPVPCERSREFVTVQDGQQTVRVRVAQGESRLFSENLLLGELELTGLRAAPRGQLRISVTFGLDSDGMLHVRAIDLDTGRATTSELRLAGIPSPAEVAQMTTRQMLS
jgi:molecular chaperone DnaK